MDSTRAAFVKQEYRFETAQDVAVKSLNPNAKQLTIETNLDKASALALASAYLNATKANAQVYSYDLSDILTLEDLTGNVPAHRVSSSAFGLSARDLKVTSFKTDWLTGVTSVSGRG